MPAPFSAPFPPGDAEMPVIKVETQRKPSRDGGVVRHAEKCRPELTGKNPEEDP